MAMQLERVSMGIDRGSGAMKFKPSPMRLATRLYDDTPQVVLRNAVGPRQRMLAQIHFLTVVNLDFFRWCSDNYNGL